MHRGFDEQGANFQKNPIGTGPYSLAEFGIGKIAKVKRRDGYWGKAPYLDEIQFIDLGTDISAHLAALAAGQVDAVYRVTVNELDLAKRLPNVQLVSVPSAMTVCLRMQVDQKPFDDIRIRKAIVLAADNQKMLDLALRGQGLLGENFHVASIQPEYFPLPPVKRDVAQAKQLVQESGTAGQTVGVVVQSDDVNKQLGEYLQSVLNQIGYKAVLKPISPNIQFPYIQNTKNKVQISISSWYQDYPAASDFLHVLLSCASFHPGSDTSINISGFCDKPIDTQMDAALSTEQTSMTQANTMWGQVDKAIMAQAPTAPLFTPKLIDFTSSRIKHYEFSKQFYMLVDQLWVK